MKTSLEILNYIKECKTLCENIKKEFPQVKGVDINPINNVPLKTIIKVADKLKLKAEYQSYSKQLVITLYSFREEGVSTTINSVKVERTTPPPVPVTLEEYKEVKP